MTGTSLNFTAGRSDYTVVANTGAQSGIAFAAQGDTTASSLYTSFYAQDRTAGAWGNWWRQSFVITGLPLAFNQASGTDMHSPAGSLTNIKDGTSNTILLIERSGGNILYDATHKPIPAGQYVTTSGANDVVTIFTENSGGNWADSNNWQIMNGSNFAGTTFDANTATEYCFMNCTNFSASFLGGSGNWAGGLFSFHTGGAQTLMCDGSVRFINNSISAATMIGLVTRANSDPVGEF
jgi:prepilin-type processing-associated H-X9-DG protein